MTAYRNWTVQACRRWVFVHPATVALALWALNTARAADKVIISYSSRSYAFLPAQVAVARGFFKDENLEPLLIQMRSQVAVPALMSGEVHYTLSFGNIIAGAMQGMPPVQ